MRPFFLFVLLSAPCLAQDYTVVDRIPRARCLQSKYNETWPVVQVASGRLGYSLLSTGVVLGASDENLRYILTPAHAVSKDAPTRILAENLDVKAELIATEPQHDVALLLASCPNCKIQSWTLAQMPIPQPGVAPAPGGSAPPANWGGFGPDSSQYRQLTAPTQLHGVTYLWAPGELEEGMSGGPVYEQAGVLLGMIIRRSESREHALAVHGGWIRQWITSLKYDAQGRVKDYVASAKAFDTPGWLPVSWNSGHNFGLFGRPDFSK